MESEQAYRVALEITDRTDPDGTSHYTALAGVGTALSAQKRYAAAEPLLLQAHAGLVQRQARAPLRARAAVMRAIAGRLADLYDGLGDSAQAASWRENAAKPDELPEKTTP